MEGCGLDLYGSSQRPVVSYCEHGKEPSSSIKSWELCLLAAILLGYQEGLRYMETNTYSLLVSLFFKQAYKLMPLKAHIFFGTAKTVVICEHKILQEFSSYSYIGTTIHGLF